MKTSVICSGLIGVALLLAGCIMPMMGNGPRAPIAQSYQSNGEQIYFTATSQRGDPITFTMTGGRGMMGRGGMMGGMMACATCHGGDGRGGQIWMMMTTFVAPDIRYKTLTTEEDPAYTDETIKRAITEGTDPAGNALEWPMPHWSMSEADLNDLIAFLKALP